ncbi:hypothetical protein [Acinetobacter terrae]|uniref:hypothetical protein n=1 Tax=Acinetobacter terrae TaxID=2731247 RepID=UPI001BB46C68|nr:hypothetical protein [Acinetobacter terrae]
MAEQEGKQALMIQLPWTVPQQPLVKTEIIAETNQQKIPLDLNVTSTDTTAISSFALSVIIALILGGFATWLAYWYGRKSFDLTKQSFEAVIKQIESSERTSLDLNTKLFDQQQMLQSNELEFKKLENWENQVRAVSAEYQSYITKFIFNAEYFEAHLLENNSNERNVAYKQLKELNEQAILTLVKLDLYFDPHNESLDKIIIYSDIFTVIAYYLLNEYKSKSNTNQLEKFIAQSGDDQHFSNKEKQQLNGLPRIEVLSFLMRKINDNLKYMLNKKAA